jgi:hypothetical protein
VKEVIHSMLRLFFASLLFGMSAVYGQSAAGPGEKPFHISSRGSAFGVQAEFEGTYRVTDFSVEIYVRKGTLYVSEHCPYQGRRRINYVKFGLGNNDSDKWKVENSALPLYLYVVMSPRDEHSLTDVHFSLPKKQDIDLSKRWLVVEIQEDALDAPPLPEGRKGYSFVHSCKDMFAGRDDVPSDKGKPPCE